MRHRMLLPLASIILGLLFISCGGGTSTREGEAKAAPVKLTILQLNDIYEIGTLENGKSGGLARVSSLLRELERENPNTFAMVAGDFLSPSVIGTVKLQGKRIAGAQMVDVLNRMGIDFVTFGNHEFDIKPEELQQRIDESEFSWISSNVRRAAGGNIVPFEKRVDGKSEPFPEFRVLTVRNDSGSSARIGILALTINSNRSDYLRYEDHIAAARRVYAAMRDQCDAVIALTHLTIEQDKELAHQIPALRLILGGHEHTNMKHRVGYTDITKADANARTVYVHRLSYDIGSRTLDVSSELVRIDASLPDEENVGAAVERWTAAAMEGFREQGFNPGEVVARMRETLDGLEDHIRTRQTNLGGLITNAMLKAAPDADAAIMNSGSVRIDDEISGSITQYDILRILPFGGRILLVNMKGRLLRKILETGAKNHGGGGYLQYAKIAFHEATNSWAINNAPIVDNGTYRIALSDYLLTGLEANMSFLTRDNPDILEVTEPDPASSTDLKRDIRLALIGYMKMVYGE